VIGLRSLWLDFGPCDWVHHPCVPDFWVLTSDCGWVWYGDWYEVWRLELGVLSWFMCSWFPCIYSIDILWFLVMIG